MHDEDGPKTASPAGDDEQAEALSRAAREAVRQPADPRLERSFAKLGLFSDDDNPTATTDPARPGTPPQPPPSPAATVGSAATSVDLEPLHVQLATLQATTERLERRVGTATTLLIGLAVAIAVLIVLAVVR
jgi:hypothetical protein